MPPPTYTPAKPVAPSPKPASPTNVSVPEARRPSFDKKRNPNSWSPGEIKVQTIMPIKPPPPVVQTESQDVTEPESAETTATPAVGDIGTSSSNVDRHTGKYTEEQYLAAVAAFRREKRLNATFLERELKVTLSAALAIIERMGDELAEA